MMPGNLSRVAPSQTGTATSMATNGSKVEPAPGKPQSIRRRLNYRKIWREIQRALLMTLGALLAALSYSLFQIPYNIAAGGDIVRNLELASLSIISPVGLRERSTWL